MKKTLLALAVACAAQAFAAQASATTLTFDSLAQAGEDVVDIGSSYTESGFVLSASAAVFSVWGTDSIFYTGSTALMNNSDSGYTTLFQVANNAFTLQSMDLAVMFPGVTEDGTDITFGGMKTDGTLVTQTFHVTDGAPQTFTFSGFTNLAYVGWTNDAMYHQFDNINVAAVPEPETYAMFLAGLGLMGFMGRRRTK